MVFEKNLSAIRKRSPRLAEALAEASTEGVEEVVGPRGAVVLREQGVLLGSAYDPAREALRTAEKMGEQPCDVMVAIGFGLGMQFAAYCEHFPGTLIIYEPSLARLRAALERLSVVNLFAKHRDLYIATDPIQLTQLLNARYVPGLRLRVFPHPAILRLDPGMVAEIVERTRQVKDASDIKTLTSIEQLMPWAWVTAKNGRRIAESPSLAGLLDAFRGKPAVVVAAGPSLDKQLPLLRERQDRILIIAIGQTVKALRQAGIEPHLVHVLESKDVSGQLTDAGDTTELCVALSADCHHAIYDVPTRARFVAPSAAGPMASWLMDATGDKGLTMGGGTVAQGAVGIAAALGANPILLIGQDLAFTDGRAYAKGTSYDFVEVEVGEDEECVFKGWRKKAELVESPDFPVPSDEVKKGRMVWVDGWHEGERVQTWRAYASFLEQYRDIGAILDAGGIELINCTEGGARIPGLTHRTFRETLDAVALESFEAREILLAAHDAVPPKTLADYSVALARSRKTLDQIEEAVKKARRFASKARDRLLAARNEQQQSEILRGLARHEKRIRRVLDRVPWLDALVQPEIYNSIAAARRTERLDPSLADLADESQYLFSAAANGVGRARMWFDEFEASFERDGWLLDDTQAAVDGSGTEASVHDSPAARPAASSESVVAASQPMHAGPR